ncbi:histidinol phosphate phosphatase domain-containing protein [Candidatus Omnitrophota bacterium]
MIDLHTHTLLSDGVLLPAELAQRYKVKGCEILGITDHVDQSNIDFVVPRLVQTCKDYSKKVGITLLPGCEITHVIPSLFPDLVKHARKLGAKVIIGHGETLVEPVEKGTNRAAIESGVTILAHPGLITDEDVKLAAEKGVCLEITARGGHSLSNGHVCQLARKYGAQAIFSTDAHTPANLRTRESADDILAGAGFMRDEIDKIWKDMYALCEKL